MELDIQREIRYITELAQEGHARLVTLGSLVLFSTETQDAWSLDAEDRLALCLARSGEPQPARVIQKTDFAIEWNAQSQIVGNRFVVTDRTGRRTAVLGIPLTDH